MQRALDYLGLLLPRRRARWSIGVYGGPSPVELAPFPGQGSRPALSAKSLHGLSAHGVADPFLARWRDEWLMFFELENVHSGRGEIGLARSVDTVAWQFDRVVLAEPFHLSYPHVFEHEGQWYMLPETRAAGSMRLYRAESFPHRWTLHATLLEGDFVDATPFRHQGRWWVAALQGAGDTDALVMFHSERLEGPWIAHSSNPLVRGRRSWARPAGRIVSHDGRLLRVAQEGGAVYGRSVAAWFIDELTPQTWRESPAGTVLAPSGEGWNATGMHHVDAHNVDGRWLAAVDGRQTVWSWPLWDRLRSRAAGLRRTAGSAPC